MIKQGTLTIGFRLNVCHCRGNALAIQNVLGALLVADIFLGTNNASTIQPVVDVERAVMYR